MAISEHPHTTQHSCCVNFSFLLFNRTSNTGSHKISRRRENRLGSRYSIPVRSSLRYEIDEFCVELAEGPLYFRNTIRTGAKDSQLINPSIGVEYWPAVTSSILIWRGYVQHVQTLKLLNRIRADWQEWARDPEIDTLHEYSEQGEKMTMMYTG